ncbi:hypothetical protein ABPG74_001093 [Tetrahymena malaccensis]
MFQQQYNQQNMQRGQSAKHARSKSTTTPQNYLQQVQQQSQQQPYQNLNQYASLQGQQQQLHQQQQLNIQFQQNNQQSYLQSSNQQPLSVLNQQQQQYTEQPKRTLKPKDLNNCNSIPNDSLNRKCVTPLDKDSRNKKPQSGQRPSSKEQRKSTKVNLNSPDKYHSAQHSRTISHTQDAASYVKQILQQPSTKGNGSQNSNSVKNNILNNGNVLRQSQQSKLNSSMNNGMLSILNQCNGSSSKGENKELVQLSGYPANPLNSSQNQRKTSSMSSKNVPLPKNSGTMPSSATNQGSNNLNLSYNSNYYYKNGNDLVGSNNSSKPQTRQQRANKSVYQPSTGSAQINTPQLQQFQIGFNQNIQPNQQLIYSQNQPPYTYSSTNSQQPQQQVNMHQIPIHAHHQRSISHYGTGHQNLNIHSIGEINEHPAVFSNTNPHITYNQNAQMNGGVGVGRQIQQGNFSSSIPNTLSLSFNKEEEQQFLRNSTKFPHSSIANGNSHPQTILSTYSSQQNQIKKKIMQNSSSSSHQSQSSQQMQQHQYQIQQAAYKNEKAFDLLQKGKQSFKENNIEEALKYFQEAMKEEPMMLESQYLLGVCYLSSSQYQKAIEQFCDLLEKNEHYKRNVYLLIAIAYKKTNTIDAAIQILRKAIQQYPKYYDAFIYRGKLQVKMKRFDKAISDFDNAIHLNSQCGLGYMGKADCLRFMGEYDKAINLYTQALEKEEIIAKVAVLKRAITYLEAKQFDQAKEDLQKILNDDPQNSEAYYFKGMLHYKQKNLNEAILSFEQAIKHNNSRKAVTKALYEISKIKIELRDFYQAYHTLQRADYLDVDLKSLEKFRIFTDGVTFLMKRKHKEGIRNLTNLVKNYSLGDFLKPLVYTYRAYGYFCLGKHQKSLNDLQFIENFSKLEKPSIYNKLICEGIISAQNNQFEQAMNFFNKANKIFPQKMEPYFYKAMTLIRFSNKLIPKTDEDKRLQYKQNALKNLDKGIELNDSNSNIYFHRGLIRFSLSQINESIKDFDLAIEKAEESQSKHHYARGLAYGCIQQYRYAINDLSYAIENNPNYANAFLNRAKCLHLLEDKNSAFRDLQRYISVKQNDPDIHLWSGNLLFNIGEFDDAIKTYSNANGINRNADILLLRAKCYIAYKELNYALQDMDRIIELQTEKTEMVKFDKLCLNSLKIASQSSSVADQQGQSNFFKEALATLKESKKIEKGIEGLCFKRSDYLFYKGVYYFYLKNYEKAMNSLNKSFKIKKDYAEVERKKKLDEQDLAQLMEQYGEEHAYIPTSLEEYEFTNRTYNIYEHYFNIAAIYIMQKDYDNASKYLLELRNMIEQDESRIKQIDILFQILDDEQEKNDAIFSQFDDQALADIYNMQFFPVKNRLCSIFPRVQTGFSVYKDFSLNLYFCLPKIEPPSMKPSFDESLLENLQPTAVENKPEAPWIRRTSEGIIFTDNVQYFDDLDLKTESTRGSARHHEEDNGHAGARQDINSEQIDISYHKNHENRDDKYKKPEFDCDELMNDLSHYLYQDYQDIDYLYAGEEPVYKQSPQVVDKSKLKDLLKLDDDIEKKLAKLQKKNKE